MLMIDVKICDAWNDHFVASQLRVGDTVTCLNPWNRSAPLSLPAATTCNGVENDPSISMSNKGGMFWMWDVRNFAAPVATIRRKPPSKHQFSGNLEVGIIILMEVNPAWISIKQISHPCSITPEKWEESINIIQYLVHIAIFKYWCTIVPPPHSTALQRKFDRALKSNYKIPQVQLLDCCLRKHLPGNNTVGTKGTKPDINLWEEFIYLYTESPVLTLPKSMKENLRKSPARRTCLVNHLALQLAHQFAGDGFVLSFQVPSWLLSGSGSASFFSRARNCTGTLPAVCRVAQGSGERPI